MKVFFAFVVMLVASIVATASKAASGNFPDLVIPNNYGVNIHHLSDVDGEMDAIAQSGFKIVRTDLHWANVEKSKGSFDWTPYDKLAESAKSHGLRMLFILDYSNPVYEPLIEFKDEKARSKKNVTAPHHPESVSAYANFARLAAQHFKPYDPIWEIWNEPEWAMFWPPQSDVLAYIALAKASCSAIRSSVADATIIGPAAAKVPSGGTPSPPFLTALLASKIGDCFSAISIHPYLSVSKIDSAPAMWQQLRDLIAAVPTPAPAPLAVSSEWGLSTVGNRVTPETQGSYLVRMMLLNQADGIPVSIWYDWKDDGETEEDPENRFGVVDFHGQPKPAQVAMRTMTAAFTGYQFQCRREARNTTQLVFKSSKGDARKLAVWAVSNGISAWKVDPADEMRLSFIDFPNLGEVKDLLGHPVSVTKSGNDFWILKGGLQPFYFDLKPGSGPCARATAE